ncbi:hypothetical protein KIN20_036714 [Parelaphostrongylus tenuis]|uniref:Uncharacterized protein n=1 Tax=Parelaphostrongylus tenuis TaxID=148309 RepID=A0AAD5RDS8_PARTN|nr:hypothetical protein KIN20_036714 [Parelaphostrongylus tenuis]
MAQWLKVLCDLHHRIMHEVSMLMVPSCTQHSASQPSLRHRGLKNIRPQARVERTGVLPIPGARVTATPWRPPLCYHSFFDVTYRLCRQPNRRVCFGKQTSVSNPVKSCRNRRYFGIFLNGEDGGMVDVGFFCSISCSLKKLVSVITFPMSSDEVGATVIAF